MTKRNPSGKRAGKKPGRPTIDIDAAQVEALARLHCTLAEIGAVVGCSADTLERRFADVIAKGREEGRISLRRAQLRLALDGNATMLIWLGKQMLGQADEQRIRVGDLTQMTDDELQALAAGKIPKP